MTELGLSEKTDHTRFFFVLATSIMLAALAVFAYTQHDSKTAKDLKELRTGLYERCLERAEYDMKSQETRLVQREYWIAYISAERLNTFTDDALRAQRIDSAQKVVESLDMTLSASVVSSCERYKP